MYAIDVDLLRTICRVNPTRILFDYPRYESRSVVRRRTVKRIGRDQRRGRISENERRRSIAHAKRFFRSSYRRASAHCGYARENEETYRGHVFLFFSFLFSPLFFLASYRLSAARRKVKLLESHWSFSLSAPLDSHTHRRRRGRISN